MTHLYNKYILPRITHALCASRPNMKQREKIVPLADGRVLEIGVGSGLNIRYYDTDKVDHLFALDPSEEMWSFAKENISDHPLEVEYIKGMAEEIPMATNSTDSIVITYTLCTLPDLQSSFSEMRRVLKPNGKLLFCEHGMAPDKSIQRWQNMLNPIWKRLGGGCNLNRNIPQLISDGAFEIKQIDTMYIPGFKPASYNYWGVAKPL